MHPLPLLALAAVLAVLWLGTLTPTKRFINTTSCTFTPTGGSAVTITGITSLSLNLAAEEERASGDGDIGDTFGGVVSVNPTVDIEVNEIATMNAVTPGAFGVLVFTRNDARNGALAGGGALTYTVTGAYYMPQADTAPHRKVATGKYTFHTQSSDGSTSAVAVAAA